MLKRLKYFSKDFIEYLEDESASSKMLILTRSLLHATGFAAIANIFIDFQGHILKVIALYELYLRPIIDSIFSPITLFLLDKEIGNVEKDIIFLYSIHIFSYNGASIKRVFKKHRLRDTLDLDTSIFSIIFYTVAYYGLCLYILTIFCDEATGCTPFDIFAVIVFLYVQGAISQWSRIKKLENQGKYVVGYIDDYVYPYWSAIILSLLFLILGMSASELLFKLL